MPTHIFVNLPVRDLEGSVAFYEALGFSKNPQFSDDTAACIVISDTIYVMLLNHPKFMQFSPRPIADAKATAQVLLCLSAPSREAVDDQVRKAVAAGGAPDPTPTQEYGFMYGRSYEDPDGHIWEVMWMDPAARRGRAGRSRGLTRDATVDVARPPAGDLRPVPQPLEERSPSP